MKALKILAPVALALTALTAPIAHANDTMDEQQAVSTTTKVRQVNYACTSGGQVSVKYGFNRQNLPTYAQAYVGGKIRFMPINLAKSDSVGTSFGAENGYMLGTEALTLHNYHTAGMVGIQNHASEFTHKDCRVKSVKKIKG